MPHLFLEYKPLIEDEREFISFWNKVKSVSLKEGITPAADLYKVREGLFLAVIEFTHESRTAIQDRFGENSAEGIDMNSACKSIRIKYIATHKGTT